MNQSMKAIVVSGVTMVVVTSMQAHALSPCPAGTIDAQFVATPQEEHDMQVPVELQGVSKGVPVIVSIPELMTSDRDKIDQPNEQVRVVFKLDGDVVAVTPWTLDIDNSDPPSYQHNDLGSVSLPEGADEVLVVHYNDSEYGGKAIPKVGNSMKVEGFCYTVEPIK